VGKDWRFKRTALARWVEAQRPSRSRRRRVLVVDDERVVRELARCALERAGFAVCTASSGEEALEVMRREHPQVVLLDLKMPGMDGPSTLRQIRARYGRVPVIVMTGYGEGELITRALPCSPITVLGKPATLEQLVAAVSSAFESLGASRVTA